MADDKPEVDFVFKEGDDGFPVSRTLAKGNFGDTFSVDFSSCSGKSRLVVSGWQREQLGPCSSHPQNNSNPDKILK